VYCEDPRLPRAGPPGDWPSAASVVRALAEALGRCGELDSITLSGCGEPTEHPDFERVVVGVLEVARVERPGLPVRILTSGANAVRPEVRRALDRLDERIVIVDADPERVDRPERRSPLGGVVQGVSLLRDFTAQSCFLEGAVSNVGEEALRHWMDLLDEMRPRFVQVTTPSRKPAVPDIWPVSPVRLEEIARTLRRRTGLEARAFA
jgi:wyosine [tRNA(Phe)-imidazoG37] synthetase (radical SAM superfamily)